MPARRVGGAKPFLFISSLLLTTAFVAPAFAQVEQVVVTAQRRSENIQNVPIAVTAFSSEDLQNHQIQMAKDLQFATPNVTYTRTNFSGDDFSIRGIGNDVISGGGESGVAVSFSNIYLAGQTLDLASFYDLDRVEVLEGPQSTLYGRGATAGTVNIVPAKPDLESGFVNADVRYGNYNLNEERLAVNFPIVDDQMGLRIAFDRNANDGFVTNVFNDTKIDSRNDYSFRGTLRWEPTNNTIIDIVASSFHKNDTTMRSQRQQCLYDPTGTLGCLPNGLANQAINENAFFASDLAAIQSFALIGLPPQLGIVDLQTQAPEVFNPSEPFHVSTDFTPVWRADSTFLALNGVQHLADWLEATLDIGYSLGNTLSQESYNNSAPQPLDQTLLATSEATFFGTMTALGATPAYEASYSALLPGTFPNLQVPVSALTGLGISTNRVAFFTDTFSTFDQSNAHQKQYSIDLRFLSHYNGPFNFLLGFFYLRQEASGDYFVTSGAQGYASMVLGGIEGLAGGPGGTPIPACIAANGCTFQTVFYDNSSPPGGITLKSKAIYGELYYQILEDLKFTAGARWTEDYKSSLDRITLFNGPLPFGTADASALGIPFQSLANRYDKWTGRAVLDYTPKLDYTDQTLVYASYSRGYKAGGFNPGLSTFAEGFGIQSTYLPEGIDAFEVGTKNTLLHSTLQANFDVWYYNYENLQVSQILFNDSINANVNSRMYGGEGQFVYAPDEHWLFNLNFGYVRSAIGDSFLVDPRNPTNGAPNAVLIKDFTPTATAGQNCAVYLLPGQTVSPGDNATMTADLGGHNPYFAPPATAGGSHGLAQFGIPLTNYGPCNPALLFAAGLSASPVQFVDTPELNAFGYSFNQPGGKGFSQGVPVSLHGNENPYTPKWTVSFGAQYTIPIPGSYTLVPRIDVYWQTATWGRIFEDPADRIPSYAYANAQVQLNSPDNTWYVKGWVKNMFNKTYITGEYLTSSSSGLFTNQFLGDPRTYGVMVGVHF